MGTWLTWGVLKLFIEAGQVKAELKLVRTCSTIPEINLLSQSWTNLRLQLVLPPVPVIHCTTQCLQGWRLHLAKLLSAYLASDWFSDELAQWDYSYRNEAFAISGCWKQPIKLFQQGIKQQAERWPPKLNTKHLLHSSAFIRVSQFIWKEKPTSFILVALRWMAPFTCGRNTTCSRIGALYRTVFL